MKLLTWNVSYNASVETFNSVADLFNPDVALLQEVTPKIYDSKLPGLYQIVRNPIGGKRDWGSAVLVRSGINMEPVSSSPDPWPGWVTGATISTPTVDKLSLWSLHARFWDLDGKKHYIIPHLRSIFDYFAQQIRQGDPFVVGGDFNADRIFDQVEFHPDPAKHGPFFDYLENDLKLVNCTKEFIPGKIQTFYGKGSVIPVQDDYVFLSPSLKSHLRNCVVPDRNSVDSYSDHSPVVVELDI